MYFAVLQVHLNFSYVSFLLSPTFASHCIVDIFCSVLDGAISLCLCPSSLSNLSPATSVKRSWFICDTSALVSATVAGPPVDLSSFDDSALVPSTIQAALESCVP